MPDKLTGAPDSTAVRVALWRALHVQADPPPHVLSDEIGLALADVRENWRTRKDMDPRFSARARASIVARARFVEDLVAEKAKEGVGQYVILGAGLDTFAQRRPKLASSLQIFEVDHPEFVAWKRGRLEKMGYGVPAFLRPVPVDFESESWDACLIEAGFDAKRPAVVASTGVVPYLTREAIVSKLRSIARFAEGSTLAVSFMLPLDLVEAEERIGRQMTEKFARSAGTPFLSLFSPDDIVTLAHEAGFRATRYVPAAELERLYFTGRSDGLRPSSSEAVFVASN